MSSVQSIVELLIDDILLSLESQMTKRITFDDVSYICLSSDESSSTIWIHSCESSSSLPSLSLVPKKRKRVCSESDDERLPTVNQVKKYTRFDFDLSSDSSSSVESSYLPSISLEPRFKQPLIVISHADDKVESRTCLPSIICLSTDRQHDLDSTMEDASDFDFD
jgi:hypothetical protein